MSIAKRHHTVPQFYLRGFAANDQVGTVRLPGVHRFLQPVRKAASENNFYSVEGHEDGPDIFEKLLAGIEGEVAGVFEKIVDGVWPLGPSDRMALAAFIALQAVRGPDQRRNMEHISAQVTRLEIGFGGRAGVKDWVERNFGRTPTEAQSEKIWEQATQPDGPPIRVSSVAHLKQMAELSEALLPYIAGRPWVLVRFNKRSLITCDTPVGLVRRQDEGDDDPWEGVGFMTAWGITYPVTRKIGLVLSDPMILADRVPVERVRDGKMDLAVEGSTAHEKFINGSTVESAGEWLYHHPDDTRFVPSDLPDPSPVTLRMAGGPETFSGEPLFKPASDGPAVS